MGSLTLNNFFRALLLAILFLFPFSNDSYAFEVNAKDFDPANTFAIRLVGGKRTSFEFVATTVEQAHEQGEVRAGRNTWQCSARRCSMTSKNSTPSMRDCKDLARHIGGISSYGHTENHLSSGELGRCNVGIFVANKPGSDINFPPASIADIKDLKAGLKNCSKNDKPNISFTAYPEVPEAWPRQYIQLSWSIADHMERRWPHKVYLRKGEVQKKGEPDAEIVSPIWTKRLKVKDLPEGKNTFYLTTLCGIARVDINKAPRPHIEKATGYILRGKKITIEGSDFRDWNRTGFRKVMITEPGQTRELEVVDWSDTEITALVDDSVLPGRRKVFIDSGLDKGHKRESNRAPLTVVKRERFPSLNVIQLLEDLFKGTTININNRAPRLGGSGLKRGDAYVQYGEELGGKRVDLKIPEYTLKPEPDTKVNYYVNDIRMDAVRVGERGGGFVMTLYFENLHDEFVGDLPVESKTLGPPPPVQLDNLRVNIQFELVAENGLITLKQSYVEVLGDWRGDSPSCNYGSVNVCSELYKRYESDVRDQLQKSIDKMLSMQYNKDAIGLALKPWLRSNGLNEVARVRLEKNEIVIDYIP